MCNALRHCICCDVHKKNDNDISTKTHRLKTRLLQLTNANETRVYVIHSILLTLERKILQATTKSST